MLWSSAALISLLASLASTQAAPASLTERQGACTEGNGVDHYVMLHPGQYTTVMSMDKNKADEWAWPDLKDPSKQAVGPWYFTSKGPKPYTVEHFEVTTYLEVPGKTWAEVWGNPKSTVREGLFDCRVEAPYGISPGCVSISLNALWDAGRVITPSQADVTTSCVQIA